MVRLYKTLADARIAVVLFLVGLLFPLYLFPTDADNFRASGGPGHAKLQREYEQDEFVGIVKEWGKHTGSIESAVQRYREHLIKLDIAFPFLYVAFLLSAIARLTDASGKPGRWTLALFLLPVLGGMFDLAENYMHISMLQGAKSVEDLYSISSVQMRLSFVFMIAKFCLTLGPLAAAVLVSLYRYFFKMDKQTREDEDVLKRSQNIYTQSLDTVIGREKRKIGERRDQAAKEFQVAQAQELSKSQKDYKKQLADEERKPIGLTFSGGGIRSACFNLGLVQGLARYGILPWVDYMSSVSGGGLTASCMTTLLSMDKKNEQGKREYFHFNTQWDYFPFNPELKVFDSQGVAHDGEPSGQVGPPLERGANTQLAYLRDKGNYIIPRLGWATRDVLRGVGAILVRIGYTVLIFLLALVALSAFHYGITAALTPSIMENIDFDGGVIFSNSQAMYPQMLAAGFAFSLLIGLALTAFYRNDPTRKYKLRRWKSPRKDTGLETYLAISNLRLAALVSFLGLFVLTLGLAIKEYSTDALPDFYWAWALLCLLFALAAGWFVVKTRDFGWVKQGVPEQLRLDSLVIRTVAGLYVWVMALLIAYLRFSDVQKDGAGPQIFWIWLPVIFTLGGLAGLAFFRVIPLRQHVFVQGGKSYAESVGWLEKYYDRILAKNEDYEPHKSRGVDFKLSRWANPEFRSIFWSLQGLLLYGLVVFLALALLMLPHYFLVARDANSGGVVPLATVILSAGWAALLSYVNGKDDFKAKNLIAKAITLPGKLRNYVLGLLVIVLNLSVMFIINSRIDGVTVSQAFGIGAIALGCLWISGRFADFNYLAPHFFFRDRIAAAYLKTEITTQVGDEGGAGKVKIVRDDREERLSWMTPDGCSAPYHIVLVTLNLPGSWRLELKDRKSRPFIFSKLYCGSDITGYVKTQSYRGGITPYVGAITLSGAAVSSSIGYHTFFAQAFMTTLLNVRVGLWMISPEQYKPDVLRKYAKPHQGESRVFWPSYLWDEARGKISERRPLINLTDGEHTGDNLGLYPLLQRRCKVIIVGDASADAQGHCTSLFRVIHQAQVDLGIEVDIKVDALAPAKFDQERGEVEPSKRHFAVGKIRYPRTQDAQGKDVEAEDGWLIYFKPAVTSDDPSAILQYWKTHKLQYPHPSTADQFFDEEQFEIQRYLGEWSVEYTLGKLEKYYKEKQQVQGKGLGDKLARYRRVSAWRGVFQEVPSKGLDKLATRKNFVKKLRKEGNIDFDTLFKNPAIMEEFFEALRDITNAPDDKKKE